MATYKFISVQNLTKVVDHTLLFKDDLIESATRTLLDIKTKHNKKQQKLLKQKNIIKSRNKSKSTAKAENVITTDVKPKNSKSAKKRIETVYVGIHSRYRRKYNNISI